MADKNTRPPLNLRHCKNMPESHNNSMNRFLTAHSVCILFAFALLNCSFAGAQDEEANRPEQKILVSIQNRKLDEAASLIDKQLRLNPHNHKIHRLRNVLSSAYFRSGNRQAGDQQIELLLQYHFDDPVNSRPMLKRLPQLLINLASIQRNVEPKASKILDQSIALLSNAAREEPGNVAYSNGLTSAIGLKARLLVQTSRTDQGVAIYRQELDRLRTRWRDSPENPDALVRLVYFLKSAEEAVFNNSLEIVEDWNLERRNLLDLGLKNFPQSSRIVKEYFDNRLSTIAQYEQACPKHAVNLYATASAEILATINKQQIKKSLFPLRINIEQRALKLKRKFRRAEIIGETVPKLELVEWLSNSKGKIPNPDLNYGSKILVFISAQNNNIYEQLLQLSRQLKSARPKTELLVLINDIGHPFNGLPFVTYDTQISDDQKLDYRSRLVKNVIEANDFEFPFGIALEDNRFGSQFGVYETPTAYLINQGKCTGRHSINELVGSFGERTRDANETEAK